MARSAVLYVPAHEPSHASGASTSAGLEIVAVAREPEDSAPGEPGDALTEALEMIAAGEANVLVVDRLGSLVRDTGELLALLDWLEASGAQLIARDVALDTGAAAGRRSVSLVRELERLQRDRAPGRAPRGRPGLIAREPGLARRIAAMGAEGMSLQAIAEALNAEGVPTARGGTRWRPSSVQSALGYRRPRPPLRGAPPPPHEPPAPVHPRGPRRARARGAKRPGPPGLVPHGAGS